MSDRRAVSAGHLGASSVAAQEAWRVAVGGNRVESMTVEQIAHAFHNGQLNVRTPLWPPGSTGWQALGNFPEFQMHPSAYADQGLSQFVEADDDPTRMWTGGNDLPSMEAAMQAPYGGRPAAHTGVRQVAPRAPAQQQQPAYAMQAPPVPSRPGQMHSQPMHSQPMHSQPMHSQPMHSQPMAPPPVPSRPMPSRPAPTASVASHQPALVPSNAPFRSKSRGNGLLLMAGLVGLVGLGSAVLAARGNWGSSSGRANEVAVSAEAPSAPASAAAADRAAAEAEAPKGEAQLAKYEDTSAFVAGEAAKPAARELAASGSAATDSAASDTAKPEGSKLDEPKADAPSADAPSSKQATAKPADDAEEDDAPKAKSEKSSSKSARARSDESLSKRVSAREKKRSAMLERRSKPMARVEKVVEKVEAPEKSEPKPPEKVEKPEKAEKAVAAESQQAPASSAVNEAAAAALANSANLASSCRPRGGPAGSGKARIIYSNDGEVQSVEILTAKFRDTVTGSCVRMVFRRAKIPPFKGEPPTFIKSFTVPEE